MSIRDAGFEPRQSALAMRRARPLRRLLAACLLVVLTGLGLTALGAAPARAETWVPTTQDVRTMLAADRWATRIILEGSAAEAKEPGVRSTPRPGFVSLELFDRAIAGDLGNANAYFGRGVHRLETGETKKAIADLTQALELDQKLAGAFLYRGLAHEKRGLFEKARADYLRAEYLDPEGAVGSAAGWNLRSLERKPSGDQAVVVKDLGLPDAFSITVSAPSAESKLYARIELWEYRRLGRSFTFLDGKLMGAKRIPVDGKASIYPTYRPYQFLTGMFFDDLPDILGQDDFMYLELPAELMRDGELVFTAQLALGFKQGGLFYVRTVPLPLDRPGGGRGDAPATPEMDP